MWNILLPDISVIYKKEWSDLSPYQIMNGAKPDYITADELYLKKLLTTEFNKNVSFVEYLNLPEVKELLQKEPSYLPIIRACYQVEHKSLGQRKEANGDKFMQRTGMIAQEIISEYLDVDQPKTDGYDNGIDFQLNGANVDIKCMGRETTIEYDWVHNLIKSQYDNKNSKTDYYLFCSLDRKDSILQVCGYVQKSLIPKCADFIKKGDERINRSGHKITVRADMFEINQEVLCAINDLDDLIRKISADNIVSDPSKEDTQKCVQWYRLIEKAKDDIEVEKKLSEYREKRFSFILSRSSFTSLKADYEWHSKCSIDCDLDRVEAMQKINKKYKGKFQEYEDIR